MGINSSGDYFNQATDRVIEGMTNIVKEVDDVLMFSDTLKASLRTWRICLPGLRQTMSPSPEEVPVRWSCPLCWNAHDQGRVCSRPRPFMWSPECEAEFEQMK